MREFMVIRISDNFVQNRIILNDPEEWDVPEDCYILEITPENSTNIGSILGDEPVVEE